MSDRPERIVIVGGGFGGLHLVRHLERRLRSGEAEVTLLDRNDYHLFTPLLYQVATGELPPHAVAYPLRRAAVQSGARFLQTAAEAVDLEARVLRTADGPVPYDRLVLAPGSVSNDFGIPGVAEHAVLLKDLADAREVRSRILSAFSRAARESDPQLRRAALAFVIIGAGPVGVELAASIRDLVDRSIGPMYPDIHPRRDVSVTLVDAAARVIPQMDARLAGISNARLAQLDVRVLLNAPVREVGQAQVRTADGRALAAGVIVWAGGVKANPLLATLDGIARARDGRLIVDASLRVSGRDDLFALGDAAFLEHGDRPLPQLAQVAVLEAPTLAENLARSLRRQPLAEHRHRAKGDLIALGRTAAAAQVHRVFGLPVGDLVFGGLPAWTVWRVNYLTQLLGVRNRATLLTEWTLSFFMSRMVSNTP